MDSRFNNHQFVSEMEESENSPENSGGDSPRSAVSSDAKMASTSASKRSRRAIQKKVVSIPIKDVEGLRLKGDQMSGAPPSDSWAWRKYGQKPIKGSPYPRGYYRCSSSKGCPARKQVERSRVDSDMLVVTYYCEHNHPWPASRNHHRTTTAAASNAAANATTTTTTTTTTTSVSEEEEEEEMEEEEEEEKKPNTNNLPNNDHSQEVLIPDYKFSNLGEGPLLNISGSEFGWFADFESTSCTMLESPILTEDDRINTDNEMAMIFTMREEDESLFADLGELPECSTVFRRGIAQREVEQRRPTLTTTT